MPWNRRIARTAVVAVGFLSLAAAAAILFPGAHSALRDDAPPMDEICAWRETLATPASAQTQTQTQAAEPPPARPLLVALVDGRVVPGAETVQVRQGTQVDLRFTSDRPIVLRLHGYEVETHSNPQQPGAMAFKATLPGRFPVHEHRAGAGNHRAVLFVDVRP